MPDHAHRPPNPDAPPSPVTARDIEDAARRIAPFAHSTPVMTSRTLDQTTGAAVLLKCENLQRTGSFKFRGATNAITRLLETRQRTSPPQPLPEVLTFSSGNHAQAVALASAAAGIRATIIMPSDAPAAKLNATRRYLASNAENPGEVIVYDRAETTREDLADRIARERHDKPLTVIPPYDHPDVIAGQGTAARELFRHAEAAGLGSLDALFVCVGGGGLLSGCALAAKHANPACTVIGVEPELADDAARSFRTRTLHTVTNPPTIADGARTPSLGRYTFPLVLNNADHITTVTEAEIATAMRFALERTKLLVEPAGALALAGLLRAARTKDPINPAGLRAGVIISGGNTDLERAISIITKLAPDNA